MAAPSDATITHSSGKILRKVLSDFILGKTFENNKCNCSVHIPFQSILPGRGAGKNGPIEIWRMGIYFLPPANPDEDQTLGRATRRKSSKDNFFLMGLFITLDSPDFLVLPYCNWLDSIWDYQLFFCCQGTKMLECFAAEWGEPFIHGSYISEGN